jgi:uncharacterized protein YjbI with pentapeptide repeats
MGDFMKNIFLAIFVYLLATSSVLADQDFGYRFREIPKFKGFWTCLNAKNKRGGNDWVGECGMNRDQDLQFIRREGMNLNGSDFCRARLKAAELRNCQMQGVSFQSADISGASFAGSDLRKAWISGLKGYGADFSNANLQGAKFYQADLNDAVFVGADLRNSDFYEKGITGLERSRISGANFSNARFEGAYLADLDIDGTVKLSGATYDEKTRLPMSFKIGDAEKYGMRKVP